MSRIGKCIDNAPTESFFGFFKTESYHLKKYNSYDELVNDVARYIEHTTLSIKIKQPDSSRIQESGCITYLLLFDCLLDREPFRLLNLSKFAKIATRKRAI